MKKKKYNSDEYARRYADYVLNRIDKAMKNINEIYGTDTDNYIDLINAEIELVNSINERGYIGGDHTKENQTADYNGTYSLFEHIEF